MLKYVDKWIYARGTIILLAVLWMACCVVKTYAHVEIHIDHTPEIDNLTDRLEQQKTNESWDRLEEHGWDNISSDDQDRIRDSIV